MFHILSYAINYFGGFMGERVVFILSDEEYKDLMAKSGGKSPGIFAKSLVLDGLYRQETSIDFTLKSNLRTLTIMQRFVAFSLGDERSAELFELAREDENHLKQAIGVSIDE